MSKTARPIGTVIIVFLVVLLISLFSAKKHLFKVAPVPATRYAGAPKEPEDGTFHVKRVIDGDTILLRNGDKVRYVGIDTPERDEPLYREARERNRELIEGKTVRLEVCKEESRDKYGRILAWAYAGQVLIEEVLLKEGLARTLTIPPCGLKHAEVFEEYERSAKESGLGIWAGGQ